MPDPFVELGRVAEIMAGYDRPWAFCGGWAIDLFLGRVTRSHKDVDIAVARRDQHQVQAHLVARGWQLAVAHDGVLTPWRTGECVMPPRHGVWARHPTADPSFIEILLNEIDDTRFRFRRDQSIAMPLDRAFLRAQNGLSVLAPEIALLYTSRHADEAANQADFDEALPALRAEQRAWLRAALTRIDPRHSWLGALSSG